MADRNWFVTVEYDGGSKYEFEMPPSLDLLILGCKAMSKSQQVKYIQARRLRFDNSGYVTVYFVNGSHQFTLTQHYYVFEIWPDGMDYRSYPMQLPQHLQITAFDQEIAYREARKQIDDKEFLILSGHNRYKCQPAHGGVN